MQGVCELLWCVQGGPLVCDIADVLDVRERRLRLRHLPDSGTKGEDINLERIIRPTGMCERQHLEGFKGK